MGRLLKDYSGQTIQNIKCLKFIEHRSKHMRALYLWQCPKCINKFKATVSNIKSLNTSSCGCNTKTKLCISHLKLKPGTQFGDLVVIGIASKLGLHSYSWCVCLLCHKEIERRNDHLKKGLSSCACSYEKGIGKNEKSILDEYEKKNNLKLQRQYSILNYYVDGYDITKNVVVEVYEKHHDKQVFKDLKRENEICNKLSCEFHIIYDRR